MMEIFIYKLVAPNGKIYIGQTNNIKRRFQSHKTSCCDTKISRSIKKYGWETFAKEILIEANEKCADDIERFYIKFFDSVKCGLNLESGGNKNKKLNEETKDKLRQRVITDEMRKKYSKKMSDLTKQKLSLSKKGKALSIKHKEAIQRGHLNRRYPGMTIDEIEQFRKVKVHICKPKSAKPKSADEAGKIKRKLTDEQKEKIRKSHLGYKFTDEAKNKMRIAKLGRKLGAHTEEWNRKISQSLKKYNKQDGN